MTWKNGSASARHGRKNGGRPGIRILEGDRASTISWTLDNTIMLNNALIIGKYVLIGLASIRGAVDTYSAGKWAYAKGFGKKGEAPGSHTAANNTQQEAHVA